MRISHTHLEQCRRNPAAWVASRRSASGSRARWSYSRVTKCAIYKFHQTGSLAVALDYLRWLCERVHLHTQRRIAAGEEELRAYVAWCQSQGLVVIEHRFRITLPIGSNVLLGGEVSRLDFNTSKGGYRAVLLGEPRPDWRTELRMPLVQQAVALRFSRSPADVSVAVQRLDGSGLAAVRNSAQRIAAAEEEARQLAARIGVLLHS